MKIFNCPICGCECNLLLSGLYDERHGAPGKYDLHKCNSCDFIFTTPRIAPEIIGEFYKKYYPHSKINAEDIVNKQERPSIINRYFKGNRLFPFREIKEDQSVLDVGCGCGKNIYNLSNSLRINACGIEPDPSAVETAQKLGLNVKRGFLGDRPFGQKKFDYIIASQVFEHIPDPWSFLTSAYEQIEDKGTLFLSFPNIDSINRKLFGRKWINWHIPYHQNFFSEKSIKYLAEQTGFVIFRSYTVTPCVWYRMQIRTLFTRIKEGQVNPIWQPLKSIVASDNGDIPHPKNITFVIKIIIRKIIWFTVDIIGTPFYRMVDLLGQGDAIVYQLKKKI